MKRRASLLAAGAAVVAAAAVFAVSTTRPGVASPEDATAVVATLSSSIDFFEQRLAADPENFLAASHLADRYILRYQLTASEQDVRRAETVARAAVGISPSAAGALARLSSIHLAQHQFASAMAAAEEAVRDDDGNGAALSALFDAAMASGRYDRAEWAIRRLPVGSADRQIRTARWLSAHGETDGAYGALNGVCAQFERESMRPQLIAWCLTELAALQRERGGGTTARAQLRDALRAQPGYRGAIEALAELAHADSRWKEAAQLYRSVAADAHPDIYLRLSEMHRALGDAPAADTYDQAFFRIAARPEAEALHAYSLALFYAARPATRDAALQVALRDVENRPAVESYDVLSWVRFRRGELPEALAASDSAFRWGAPSPTMQYHRARILQALGREAEAAPLMRAALRRPDLLDPEARLELNS